MSASREKKKRQELLASGTVDPKAARAAEQEAAERKSNILYGTVAAVFVVVAAALLIYNSGIIQRNQTAVTIDGQKYTVPQTAYYYAQVCSNYASFFGQEYLQTLKAQPHPTDEGKTYNDYFKESAVDTMKYVHAAVTAAKSAGVSLDSDDEATVKANVDSVKSAAASAGYSYSAYLKAVYGPTMSGSVYESCLRDQILASKYASVYSEENFVYTDAEVQVYYETNKDSYDLVDGAYVTISGAPEAQTDANGNAVEATDEEKTAAMDAAREAAELILATYQTSKNLETASAQVSSASYTASTEMSSSASIPVQWLFAEGRKSGDAEVLVDESNSRYYVAVFNGRQRNEALDYNVRHILVTSDSLGLAEGETATEEQLTAKAQEILNSWDGTEAGFAKLANEYSKDGGSNTNGGLYENVPKGRMIAAFQDWCYEDGRKSGDTGIVYSSSTGAHVMYFVGYGSTPYWYYACESALRNDDISAWQNNLTESANAEMNAGGMKNVG